ncbi:hypothetical protein CALCODRAFT_481645 [Calocera cornea HHB12733]|uniref:Uncharacterized protein n=1 Tax=Calocera cornea HHB12733 TaxID=1353952 RepID=A0A165HF98_9BASI|nr:hypothetical protein CALCODRAFT_481645 [Calocera cornea HHB12733]
MVLFKAFMTVQSAKVLCATLKCLSRFDEEVEILPEPDKITFAALNRSNTAYGRVVFNRRFFVSFDLQETIPDDAPVLIRYQENGRWTGRLQVKVLFDRLKRLTFTGNVKTISLTIEDEPGREGIPGDVQFTSMLRVNFECPYQVTVVHHMSVAAGDEQPLAPRMLQEPRTTIVLSPIACDCFASVLRRTECRPKGLVFCTLDPSTLSILGKPGKSILEEEVKVHGDDLPRYDVGGTTTKFKAHAREFSLYFYHTL